MAVALGDGVIYLVNPIPFAQVGWVNAPSRIVPPAEWTSRPPSSKTPIRDTKRAPRHNKHILEHKVLRVSLTVKPPARFRQTYSCRGGRRPGAANVGQASDLCHVGVVVERHPLRHRRCTVGCTRSPSCAIMTCSVGGCPGRKVRGAFRRGLKEHSPMKTHDIPRSGKRGRIVAYKSRYGQCEREDVKPTKPWTQAQLDAQEAFGDASSRLKDLTDEQQDAWAVAGRKVRSHPRGGQSGPLTAQNFLTAINRNQALLRLPPFLYPPERPVFETNPVGAFRIIQGKRGPALKLSVAKAPAGHILVYASRPYTLEPKVLRQVPLPRPAAGSGPRRERHHRAVREEVWPPVAWLADHPSHRATSEWVARSSPANRRGFPRWKGPGGLTQTPPNARRDRLIPKHTLRIPSGCPPDAFRSNTLAVG